MFHVIPSLPLYSYMLNDFLETIGTSVDISLIADFLFCVNSFLADNYSTTEHMVRAHKHGQEGPLFFLILKNLNTQAGNTNMQAEDVLFILRNILQVLQQAQPVPIIAIRHHIELTWVFELCQTLASQELVDSIDVICRMFKVVQDQLATWEFENALLSREHVEWIYLAMAHALRSEQKQMLEAGRVVLDSESTALKFTRALIQCRDGLNTKPPLEIWKLLLQHFSLCDTSNLALRPLLRMAGTIPLFQT
ncbi:hypothetical protein FB45DRAFT_448179 [Roridomyces roridus]|uniref:Uncharacterized protein n=1 Tax=Roridomyces roridus TaxID=1738132 RepID=A0AAD7C1I7_9AGAR|nr:hypothetical protein FB45DRAFT_448179 [Roridomyces roridus]